MAESIETFIKEFSEETDKIRNIIERAYYVGYHEGWNEGYLTALKEEQEEKETIQVGDVCTYSATINESFVYLGKKDGWHYAIGTNTLEKYKFRGLTGIKKTIRTVTNLSELITYVGEK